MKDIETIVENENLEKKSFLKRIGNFLQTNINIDTLPYVFFGGGTIGGGLIGYLDKDIEIIVGATVGAFVGGFGYLMYRTVV